MDLGILVVPKQKIHVITKDPADNKFLECAATAKVDYLITGNTHHFDFNEFEGVKIVPPAQFLIEFKIEWLKFLVNSDNCASSSFETINLIEPQSHNFGIQKI